MRKNINDNDDTVHRTSYISLNIHASKTGFFSPSSSAYHLDVRANAFEHCNHFFFFVLHVKTVVCPTDWTGID